MDEAAYNLFLYVEKLNITALGIVVHTLNGTDAEKLSMLQCSVEQDYKNATVYHLQTALRWQTYQALMRLGRQLEIFEHLFREYKAPINPLVVVTPILDKKPYFLATTDLGALRLDDLKDTPLAEPGTMCDYLSAYELDGVFDLPRLINDDYFLAIKLLWNERHHTSAAKLLVSFIDTVAFIDQGDLKKETVFVKWLNDYANLGTLGITSAELWEFRNGLLHMTNLNSRSVAKGDIARLMFYVGTEKFPLSIDHDGTKYFNLKELINTINEALSRWINSYNENPAKWVDFVERYDLVISDARLAYISIPSSRN